MAKSHNTMSHRRHRKFSGEVGQSSRERHTRKREAEENSVKANPKRCHSSIKDLFKNYD